MEVIFYFCFIFFIIFLNTKQNNKQNNHKPHIHTSQDKKNSQDITNQYAVQRGGGGGGGGKQNKKTHRT